MDYYAIIEQKGYTLTLTENNIPYQHSGNIPIKIVIDSNFSGYEIMLFYVQSKSSQISYIGENDGVMLEYDDTTGIAVLPYSAFAKSGYTFISLALTKDDTAIYCGTVSFEVKQSVSGDNNIPAESVWLNVIKEYIDQAVSNISSASVLPSGGTAGQVLTKSSSTDYDVSWATPSGGVVRLLKLIQKPQRLHKLVLERISQVERLSLLCLER